jgi:regulatory protein
MAIFLRNPLYGREHENMPIISAIEPQRKAGRLNIYVEGEFAIGVSERTAKSLGLKIGQEADKDTLREISLAEEKRRAMESAGRLLSIRPRASAEIRQRLSEKGYEPETTEAVIAQLTSVGYLDDAQFARLWTESRLRSSPRGALLIKTELRQKGVKDDDIEKSIGSLDEEEELKSALALIAKKHFLESLNGPDIEGATRRMYSLLQRRGFRSSVIRKAISASRDGVDLD